MCYTHTYYTYCPKDKRLGTVEELRDLTTRAHELGMYVIVDVVMNHMGDEFYFSGHRYGQSPFRFHDQNEYELRPRRPDAELFDTPAGKQPYMDFWHNNTWDPAATYDGPCYGQYGEAAYDNSGETGTYAGSQNRFRCT